MTTSHSQARHRSTPDSHVSALVAQVASSTRKHRRRTAVIAASSGLLVTMGLPATAVAAPPSAADRASTTESIPAVRAAPQETAGITVAPTATVDLAMSSLATVDSSVAEKAEADRLAAERAAAEQAARDAAAAQAQRAEATAAALASRGSATSSASRSASRSGGSTAAASTTSAVSTDSGTVSVAPVSTSGGALAIAQRYAGTPYVYGGSTPSGFDCSGLTQYVFRQMGISLPRTAAAQASAGTRVSAASARPGDLVSFSGSGGVYHIGIYAGNGMMFDSPRPGKSAGMHAIWSSSISFTRVG